MPRICADGIDILFDLSGHTAFNRLLVFARRPAPIQITWIGYEGTTGLEAIDYILGDRYTIAEGSERFYSEKVLRLPEGYVCYDPPAEAPEVGPLPAIQSGLVRFRQLQQPGQDHPRNRRGLVAGVAARAGVPLGAEVSRPGRRGGMPALPGMFAAAGIAAERLELFPPAAYAEYLAAYNQIDIAFGPLSVRRRHYHLRRPVDGGAGGLPARRNVCQPAFDEPPRQCGNGRNHRRQSGRIHRNSRCPCQ